MVLGCLLPWEGLAEGVVPVRLPAGTVCAEPGHNVGVEADRHIAGLALSRRVVVL